MNNNIITQIKHRDIVWTSDVTHLCEGADVHPGVRLLWTRCGRHDIPANGAWLRTSDDVISCDACRLMDRVQ